VLKIIKRSKKGADTATLMKKTSFDQKKVRNILHRTYKQGKITRVEKGIYIGVK
jgi:predicted transcriptional regulator of viral defense system